MSLPRGSSGARLSTASSVPSATLPLADQLRALAASLVAVSAPNSAASSPVGGPEDLRRSSAPAQRKAQRRAKAKADELFRIQRSTLPIGGIPTGNENITSGVRLLDAPPSQVSAPSRLPATRRLLEKLRAGRGDAISRLHGDSSIMSRRLSSTSATSSQSTSTRRWLHDGNADDNDTGRRKPESERVIKDTLQLQRSGDVTVMLDALMRRLDGTATGIDQNDDRLRRVRPTYTRPQHDDTLSDVRAEATEEEDCTITANTQGHAGDSSDVEVMEEDVAIDESHSPESGGAYASVRRHRDVDSTAAVTLEDLLDSAASRGDEFGHGDDDAIDDEVSPVHGRLSGVEPSPVRLRSTQRQPPANPEALADSDAQEVTAALQRCCDELALRLEACGPDDGVTSLRIANPRHPASSDRSRASLAVRELFSLLLSRLWFAEDHEVDDDASTASDSEAKTLNRDDDLDAVLGPTRRGAFRQGRFPEAKRRSFWYPSLRNAGAVTPDALIGLLRGPWTSVAVKAISSTVPGVASVAPLPLVARAVAGLDTENTCVATPFDPSLAAAEALAASAKEDDALPNGGYAALQIPVLYRPSRTGFHDAKSISLEPGTTIAGRYRVRELLGEATFCRAVLCDDLSCPLESHADGAAEPEYDLAVLKIINNSKDFFDQSLDEIRNLKLLADAADKVYSGWVDALDTHRANGGDPRDPSVLHAARMLARYPGGTEALHVVRMRDYFYFAEHMCIVCEVLKSNLYDHGKTLRRQGQPRYFTLERVRSIAHQITTALQFVHGLNLIHNDLKPENILFSSVSRCEVKVIDFGSSCFTTDKLSSYVQSRSYRAPEVFLGAPYDGGIDVWSLGCILVELLTQEVLFHSSSIPEMLARIVETCGGVPPSLLARSRHADTLFTRDGVIYAPTAEGDDVRHELYGDRNAKPFSVVKSAFEMDLSLTLRDAELTVGKGRPIVPRSSQCPVNADGSFDAPEVAGQGSLGAAEDDEEDGLYLFLPAHETEPRTAADLGHAWFTLGEAMSASLQSGTEPTVPVELLLDFLRDLQSSTCTPDALPDVRLERVLVELASVDLADALQSLSTVEEHVRREASAASKQHQQARRGPADETVSSSANTSTTLASGGATPVDGSAIEVSCDALCATGLQPLLLLHFVKLCLLVDPAERPSTARLARHPFLLVEEMLRNEADADEQQ